MKIIFLFLLVGCFSCSEDKIALKRELEKDPLTLSYVLANSAVTIIPQAIASMNSRDNSMRNLQRLSRRVSSDTTELFMRSQKYKADMREKYQINLLKKNAYHKTLYDKYVVDKKMSSKIFASVLAEKTVGFENHMRKETAERF
ncbi:MAG: hypothetical protein ABIO05_03895 [Ferruginibacter sp.]